MNPGRIFPALANRNYRIFWITQWVALIGFWLQLTAQQWLVYTMTDSALLLGLLAVFQFSPSLFFSIGAGLWIDRHNKRKILMATQFCYMVQTALLGLLLWTGLATYPWILFFAFLMGTIDAFDMPARLAFMPELVGPKALHSAISLNSANFNLTRMIGPPLAAFLLPYLSYSSLFFLNALSLIPVFLAYRSINVNSVIPEQKETRHPLEEIRRGLREARRNPIIFKNLLAAGLVSALILNMGTYGPIFADRVLQDGISGFSSILFAAGLGSMLAGILSGASHKNAPQKLIFLMAILCGVLLASLGLISSFPIAIILFTLLGAVTILFMVNCNTAIQTASPPELLGRIMSLYTLVFLGCAPFGALFVSFIIEYLDISRGLTAVGILEILLILLVKGLPNHQEFSRPETQ